ncbi:RDD family protein [Octadecabacter sp. G9-8]|uniref:RDD family protein n=1 Tax=Octadecabacter dasysiphoniae TaxID=2909341 RepID=A0ABS9CYC3_9RHOB|nr:RDD family protein [Octadecabacter dasysiphoniae]MCF2872260.1 RDD family protein [Octadecabacter dasysiphoniae]
MSATYSHPNPDTHYDFYEGVPPKRLIAWLIDISITAVIALPLMLPFLATAFLVVPLLAIPIIWALVGFFYRWNTLANRSATWGMRLMAIELRDAQGARLSGGMAFMHTLGTTLSFAFPLVQAISILFMMTSDRGQGITDLVLNTAMLNRSI